MKQGKGGAVSVRPCDAVGGDDLQQTAGKDRGRFPDGQTGAASWRRLSDRRQGYSMAAASWRVRWYDRGFPVAVGAFLASALCRSFLHGIAPALSLPCVPALGVFPCPVPLHLPLEPFPYAMTADSKQGRR